MLAFVIELLSLLKNLDFSNISLDRHIEIRGKSLMILSLMILAALSLFLPEVEPKLIFRDLGVNLLTTVFLKKLIILINRKQIPASFID